MPIQFKRNQIEEAIFRALGTEPNQFDELHNRIENLLVVDRKSKRNLRSSAIFDHHYAFFSTERGGSGVEVKFSSYEGFAVLAALALLEHGWPQGSIVRILRQVRNQLEPAYAATLRRDPEKLFNEQAAMAQAKPGMIACDNTSPVFLIIIRPGPAKQVVNAAVATTICTNHDAVMKFIHKHRSRPGQGVSFFEFVRLMHTFSAFLFQTRPTSRGRSA